jgi:alginate O-acetyltransferase complex protein AlgI
VLLRIADWLPLLLLPPTAAAIGTKFPAWIYMWLLAFSLYAGCKWLCFRQELARGTTASRVRKIGFLFGWIGMDAAKFLSSEEKPAAPRASEWIFTGLKILFGAILLWGGARLALTVNPLLAGWTGMVGIILLLHFGFFHLLALAWRRAGVPATSLMRAPLLSRSLGEFWGNRWNTAFHELTNTFLFRPLRRVVDIRVAILLVFLASGLIHDLVISVPARGGYGLPTLYFLLQGVAVLFEHTSIFTRFVAPLDAARTAQRALPTRGIRGWVFMFLVTAGPAFWLFPPPFVRHVILPMLHVIGAT